MTPAPPSLPALCDWLGRRVEVTAVEVRPEHDLVEDLQLDSLALFELTLALEEEFGVVVPESVWGRDLTISSLHSRLFSIC